MHALEDVTGDVCPRASVAKHFELEANLSSKIAFFVNCQKALCRPRVGRCVLCDEYPQWRVLAIFWHTPIGGVH